MRSSRNSDAGFTPVTRRRSRALVHATYKEVALGVVDLLDVRVVPRAVHPLSQGHDLVVAGASFPRAGRAPRQSLDKCYFPSVWGRAKPPVCEFCPASRAGASWTRVTSPFTPNRRRARAGDAHQFLTEAVVDQEIHQPTTRRPTLFWLTSARFTGDIFIGGRPVGGLASVQRPAKSTCRRVRSG